MKRRWTRWLAIGAGGVVALLVLAVGAIYALSWRKLAPRDEIPTVSAPPAVDSAALARGTRLAQVLGCSGCHGEGLGGQIMIDSPMFGRLVAPNLTRTRETYSDADFVRVLRHGLRPDGRPVIPAMPSQAFRNLSDADLAAVIAFVRSRPRVNDSLPTTRLALPLRAMLVMGMIQTVPEMIEERTSAPPAPAGDDGAALGRYLAQAICTECHGPDLGGQDRFMITPDLAIVAAYSPEQLRTFFHTGLALGDRELSTMSRIARDRYSAFTDREIDALHAYLSALPRARTAQD